eukprot:jgi/Tetstr1/420643/TSEL_011731.t1
MATPDEKLSALGIVLPPAAPGVGAYLPWMRIGDRVTTSLQLPWVVNAETGEKSLLMTGACGSAEVPIERAFEAARQCAINGIAQMKHAAESVGGDLSWVQMVRLEGNVACAPDFINSPEVLNAASELLNDVLGKRGYHTRTALHFPTLPLKLPRAAGELQERDQQSPRDALG